MSKHYYPTAAVTFMFRTVTYTVRTMCVRDNGTVFIGVTQHSDTNFIVDASKGRVGANIKGDGFSYGTTINSVESPEEYDTFSRVISDVLKADEAATSEAPATDRCATCGTEGDCPDCNKPAAPTFFDNATVKMVIARIEAANKQRLDASDVQASRTLGSVAFFYIGSYSGSFAFMVDMKAKYQAGYEADDYTAGQLAAVLNCMMREYRPNAKATQPSPAAFTLQPATNAQAGPAAPKAANPTSDTAQAQNVAQQAVQRAVPNGVYTVVLGDDEYRTIKLVDAPEHFSKSAGTQIAKYLRGADNENSYTGFAFVSGKRASLWKDFSNDGILNKCLNLLIGGNDQRWREYGEAYALKSGSCYICNRTLTVPASLYSGMGKTCAAKVGANYGERPAKKDMVTVQAEADELF